MTELGGLALATLFRGDPAQLVQWCNYHLSRGADALYVGLDRGSEALVEGLPSDPRVQWHVLDAATWSRFYAAGSDAVERKQVDALRWLSGLAVADGHRHLAFVDADELLDLAVPLERLAADHPDATAFSVGVREMWYAEGADIGAAFGATLAVRPSRDVVDWTKLVGWRAQYLRSGVLGHDVGKTIYRLPLAGGAASVHGPLSGRLRAGLVRLPAESARLLHFDSGSVATWNHKWTARLNGDAVARGLGLHRLAQLRLFEPELRRTPERQERFFAEFFSLDAATEQALAERGLVERVDVGAHLSGPLAVPAGDTTALTVLPAKDARVDCQFAMVCDRNFVQPTFATMISVLTQLDPEKSVRFVVLGDALAHADIEHFRSLERIGRNVEVQVHDVTGDLDRDVGVGRTGVSRSRATYGRVYLADLLPEQRTLYLDGDVLATRDISELFDLDIGDACIAGVPDSAALRAVEDPAGVPLEQRLRLRGIAGDDPLEYLNAGVLLLDLDNPDYRRLSLRARAYVATAGRALAQHDQDAVNLAFRGRKHRLPSTYNYMTQFYTSERAVDGDLVQRKYAAADASLIHFSGRIKPWLQREDEFYNGLYRKIVSTAEETLGVNCGFYFSERAPAGHREWPAESWTAVLGGTSCAPAPKAGAHDNDVELVDVTDTGIHLWLSADAYLHALANDLVLRVSAAGSLLLETPLTALSAPLADINERVMPGVRRIPVDLVSVLAPLGGVARDVTFALAASGSAYSRVVGTSDVVAAGDAAQPGLLEGLDIEGRVTELVGGWLHAWYRSSTEQPVALHMGAELAARRVPKALEDGTRPTKFRAAHLADIGYGSRHDRVTLCLAGTNVPLPGLRPTIAEVFAARAARSAGAPSGLAGRVRRRLAREARRVRRT